MKQPTKKEIGRQMWIAVLFAFLILSPHSAGADTYTEIGDTGDLPATAQDTTGITNLDQIDGILASRSDVDMFKINITAPAAFSATVSGAFNSQLFLFDSAGFGVFANDNNPNGLTPLSAIPAGSLSGPAGIYFLAISLFNKDARSDDGTIFPNTPFTGVNGPTGAGGGSPITGWGGNGTVAGVFPYSIALTGTTAVPEIPAGIVPFVLMGLSFLGFRLKAFLKK